MGTDRTIALQKAPRFVVFARDSAIYSLGIVVGRIVAFAFLPVVVRHLEPARFGRLDVLSTAFTAVSATLLLGFNVAAVKLYATADPVTRLQLNSTWFSSAIALGIAVCAALFVFDAEVSVLLTGVATHDSEVRLLGPIIAGSLVHNCVLGTLRNEHQPARFALVSGSSIVLSSVLVAGLVAVRPSVSRALEGQAIAVGVVAVLGTLLIRRSLGERPSIEQLGQLVRLGLPLASLAALVAFGDVVNRAILQRNGGPDESGYLGVAVRVASIVLVIALAVQTAWQPRALSLMLSAEGRATVAIDKARITMLLGSLAVAFAAATPLIVRVVSGALYSEAVWPTGLLLLAALGYSAAQLAGIGLLSQGRTGTLAAAAGTGVLTSVLCALAIVPSTGAIGAAASLALGQWAGCLMVFLLGRDSAELTTARGSVVTPNLFAAIAVIGCTYPGAGVVLRVASVLLFVVLLATSRVGADALHLLSERWTKSLAARDAPNV